jgi:phosphomannomutase
MLRFVLRPLRQRRAIKALANYSAAKDAYRRAVVSRDSRLQHQTLRAMTEAMAERLKAELAMGR